MSIIVFGSINIDLVARTPRLPIPGETIVGREFFTAAGGKGANQAVAAARLGIHTQMVGRVGVDRFGQELVASLQAAGVQTNSVLVDTSAHSGVAVISVDDAGQNSIIIVGGANANLDSEDVDRLAQLLPGAAALLLQLEIPLNVTLACAKAAKKAGVRVILDPAPASLDIPNQLYSLVDIITPNQTEAKHLTGVSVCDTETASLAAAELRQKGVGVAIVKMGDRGVFCATAEDSFFVPAFPVQAVDTTAAGDAFNGALAAAIANHLPLRQAVVWGAAAGALAATKAGAQPSMPDRQTFDAFLAHNVVSEL